MRTGEPALPLRFLLSAVLFNAAGYVLLPTLPLILHGRGSGPAQVGLVMGSFTAAALLFRAPVAALLTRTAPEPLLRWGQGAILLGFAAYLVPAGLPPVLVGRVVQGIGLAAFNTSAYLYLAELAGPGRRAEFVSLFGLAANVAMGLAPAAGSLLLDHGGEVALFAVGLVVSAAGIATVPRTHLAPAGGAVARLWEPDAWRPTAAMLGFATAYGTVMVFVPLAVAGAGLSQGWLFFSGYAVAVITTRLTTRRVLDRGGRLPWAFGGSTAVIAALALLALARSWPTFLAAAFLFGSGVGTGHPSLLVYILESVPAQRRSGAAAMGAAAFDAGTAGGAAIAGAVASHLSYAAAFGASAALFLVLLLPLGLKAARTKSTRP
ncbi:MAG: MFS transporter [Deltaproteobacteria bacterium]|nr:MFS transporter [Deltaproteobacteria bacterium]